ncbi:MAG: hypothetical protein II765_06695 [Lachnospiraceae bacterium]|jgi:hypothetical protein|nr:hypothetical protein [Lachnospiraceae bacterium]MBQ4301207.1 hypothetical protein [Lachnospiraceae bacterium]
METRRCRIDRDMIIGCAIMALLGSVGIIFSILFVFGIDLQECNMTFLTTIFFSLAFMIWGILLCRNC